MRSTRPPRLGWGRAPADRNRMQPPVKRRRTWAEAETATSEEAKPGRCPLCRAQLYGWLTLSTARGATVGMPIPDGAPETIVDRCEDCGLALPRGRELDLEAELAAISTPEGSGRLAIAAPNRASWQASIGLEGWAAIREAPGTFLLTPRSLALLTRECGRSLGPVSYPRTRAAQRRMWQTLVNGLTFHPNFAREARAGRLSADSGNRLRFYTDWVATILAAPFVAVLSAPLELFASFVRRGGEMRAEATLADPARLAAGGRGDQTAR